MNLSVLNRLPLPVRAKAMQLIPSVLRPACKLLPFSAQKAMILPILNSVFSEAIDDGDFDFLQDKWLRIAITDLGLNWWLSFADKQLIMADPKLQVSENVCFSATGDDLLLIAGRKQDPDTLFFQRRLKIEGDTELGLEVKNLIDAIEIDQLPSYIHRFIDSGANLLQQTKDELSAVS